MLTRRRFASCAICAIAGLVSTNASAQAKSGAAGAVTRKILSRTDGPSAGYETIMMEAVIEPGAVIGRHTHPGIESTYVLEGELELPVQGQPTRMVKAGDGFQIPPETPHAGGKSPTVRTKVLINYIVQKGKPLATPVA